MTYSTRFQEYLNGMEAAAKSPALPDLPEPQKNTALATTLIKTAAGLAEAYADSQASTVQNTIDKISAEATTSAEYIKRLDTEVAPATKITHLFSAKTSNLLNAAYAEGQARDRKIASQVKNQAENLSLQSMLELRNRFLDYPSYESYVKNIQNELKTKQTTSLVYDAHVGEILTSSKRWFDTPDLGSAAYVNKIAGQITENSTKEFFKIPENNYSAKSILQFTKELNTALKVVPEEVRQKHVKNSLTSILSSVDIGTAADVIGATEGLFTQDEVKSIYAASEQSTRRGKEVSDYNKKTKEYVIQRANSLGIGLPDIVTGDVELDAQNQYLLKNAWSRKSPEEMLNIPVEELPNKLRLTRADIISNFQADFEEDFVKAAAFRGVMVDDVIPIKPPVYDKKEEILLADTVTYDGLAKRMELLMGVKLLYGGTSYIQNPFTAKEKELIQEVLDKTPDRQKINFINNLKKVVDDFQKEKVPVHEFRIDPVNMVKGLSTEEVVPALAMLHDVDKQGAGTAYMWYKQSAKANPADTKRIIEKSRGSVAMSIGNITGYSDEFIDYLAYISGIKGYMKDGTPVHLKKGAVPVSKFGYVNNGRHGSLPAAVTYDTAAKENLEARLRHIKMANPFSFPAVDERYFLTRWFGPPMPEPEKVKQGDVLSIEELKTLYPENIMIVNEGNSLTKFRIKIAETPEDALAGVYYPMENGLIDISESK